MLCRLQEADRLPYGTLAFQGGKVEELQCHSHAVLLGGVHPGHQPQVFQHIERQCLVDRTRVYGDKTADALQDFLPVSALEIIRKRPLLYLLLSGACGTVPLTDSVAVGLPSVSLHLIPSFKDCKAHSPMLPFSMASFMAKCLSQSSCVRKPFFMDTSIICLTTMEQPILSVFPALGCPACLLTMSTIASKLLP